MSNTVPARITAGNAALYRAALAAARAAKPSAPGTIIIPDNSLYVWSQQMHDYARQGYTIYSFYTGAVDIRTNAMRTPPRYAEILGSSLVKQNPSWTYQQIASEIKNRLAGANAGVLGAGFDKYVVPIVFIAVTTLVTAGLATELSPAAGAAGTSNATVPAATTSTSFTAAGAVPINLSSSAAVTTIAAPSASSAFITVADSSISFTAANAAVAPNLISSLVTAAMPGGDIVATSLVNAGVSASSLSMVDPILASNVAAASFSAASAPSLATALDVLAMPNAGIMLSDVTSSAAKQAALNPATSNPSLLTQAQNLLTTMPVDASTVATAIKTVQQYNQGQAAVRQANAQAATAQQQAAAQQAALAAQAASANAPASNPLTSLSPGVILSLLAAGAAFLLS